MSTDIQPNAERLKNAADIGALREVAEGRFIFQPTLRISDISRYGEKVWRWYNASNPRLAQYTEPELTLDWEHILTQLDLPLEIVEDLKRYTFLRYSHSKIIFPRTKRNAHPATVTLEVKTVVRFLSHLRKHMLSDGGILINSLNEIGVGDIDDALSTYPMKATSCLRAVLRNFASERLREHLCSGQLRWNENDIATLEWDIKEREHYQRLPEDAFRLLSNAATADVKQFLNAVGIEAEDMTDIGQGDNLYLSSFGNFKDFFYEYVGFRVALKRKGNNADRSKYVRWVESLGNAVRRLSKLVERARMAAQIIVVMYTGARISELKFFKTDCLRRKGDVWVITGTLLKGESIHAPVGQDDWVAIPIVRDAIRVLQEVSRAAGSHYLLHGSRVKGDEQTPMSSHHLSKDRIMPYLRLIDTEKRWWHLRPSAHRFRNSIVFEMRKAGLGLPYITYQLKHMFNELEGKTNNTTLIYGGIGSEAAERVVEQANVEFIREIYRPDSPVAGGGAEELRRRRAAYFQGMTAQEIDEELLRLARENAMPLTDVGLGFCRGKKKIEEVGGGLTDPPCIGGLNCNPFRCKNGYVPPSKKPVWKAAATANWRRAEDPEFSYARPVLVAAATEQDAVVRLLDDLKRRKNGGE